MAPWRLVVLVFLVAALPIVVSGELAASDTLVRNDAAVADAARRTASGAAASFTDRVASISVAVSNAAIRPTTGRATPLIEAVDSGDAAALQRELESIHRTIDPAVVQLVVLDGSNRLVGVDP
ncbi:MAG TPA: hypothetical protein VGQ86_05065, partial [Candidatus Limnocylindria bacterium]|nr:hypothetical protein [Candidatus Limnocylindria bacterium]